MDVTYLHRAMSWGDGDCRLFTFIASHVVLVERTQVNVFVTHESCHTRVMSRTSHVHKARCARGTYTSECIRISECIHIINVSK